MSKVEFNYNNASNLVFHHFNQRKDKKYYYACIIFAAFVNITMNCKITHNIDLTRDDLDNVIDRMVKAWKLIPELNEDWFAWGKWLNWIKYTLSYIKEQVIKWRKNKSWNKWKIPNLITFYNEDEDELLKWVDRWYMFIFWMWVKKNFVLDAIDWKLESFKDYKNYKWDDLKHFTNWGKILRWWPWVDNYWDSFICDSYAYNEQSRSRIYHNFDIKEALEDILFRSKYIFF